MGCFHCCTSHLVLGGQIGLRCCINLPKLLRKPWRWKTKSTQTPTAFARTVLAPSIPGMGLFPQARWEKNNSASCYITLISKQENISKHYDFRGCFFEFCSCVSKSICCLIVFRLQFLAMSTPRPYVVLRRPHVHNTKMSHDAEVLRNPTHKIPPEFAHVLSRSYQRYLSENMKMCVSYRV